MRISIAPWAKEGEDILEIDLLSARDEQLTRQKVGHQGNQAKELFSPLIRDTYTVRLKFDKEGIRQWQ